MSEERLKVSSDIIRRVSRAVAQFWQNRKGTAAVVFSLALIPITLAAGGAVDFTRYHEVRRDLQTALDAATLAGATADNNDIVARNTFASWESAPDSTVETPQFTASTTETASKYMGTVNASLKMYFTRLIGMDTIKLTVVSHAVRTITPRDYGGHCMWLMNTDISLNLNNSASLSANSCLLTVFGGLNLSSNISLSANGLCVQSSVVANLLSALGLGFTISAGCPRNTPPTLPKVSSISTCTSADVTTEYVVMKPGTYCGTFDFNYKGNAATQYITFEPGVYVLTGGSFHFTGRGHITGSDVTFFFADASSYLDFDSSNITSTLSAPTTGSCEYTGTCGVLMYETAGLSSGEIGFDAETNNVWTGDVLLPSRDFVINAGKNGAELNITGATEFSTLTISAKAGLNLFPRISTPETENTYSVARLIK